MERKIATILTPKIAEFIYEKTGFIYPADKYSYFHFSNHVNFNGFLQGYHGDYVIKEGYEELTEQEFINYFNGFEFRERVLCDDGIERIFLFKKDDVYYCLNRHHEECFNRKESIYGIPFKSIQKLEKEPTKEEKLNKIIEQLKELL